MIKEGIIMNCIEKLADYTNNACQKKEKINENYINKIASIIVYNENLQNYIKDITFSNEGCYYKAISLILNYDFDDVIESYNDPINIDNWKEHEQNIFPYFYCNHYLLHELAHVSQFKEAIYKSNNLDTILANQYYKSEIHYHYLKRKGITLPSLLCWLIENEIKTNHYEKQQVLAPIERMAECNALKKLITLAKYLQLPNIKEFYQQALLNTYLMGYQTVDSPTLYYLYKSRNFKLIKKIIELESNLPFEKKIELGLTLTKKELKFLENKQAKLQRKMSNISL